MLPERLMIESLYILLLEQSFFIVDAFKLRETSSHKSCFILIYTSISYMLDLIDPLGSNHRFVFGPRYDLPDSILHYRLTLFILHYRLTLFIYGLLPSMFHQGSGTRGRGGAGAAYAKAPYHFLGNVGERQVLKNL